MSAAHEDAHHEIRPGNDAFEDGEIEHVFAFAAEVGSDGGELAPFTLADDVRHISPGRRRQIRRTAVAAGIAVSALRWLLLSPGAEVIARASLVPLQAA